MKLTSISAARLGCLALVFLFLGALEARIQAGELKLEAILVWGTNDEKSPDPKHKPVGPNLEKKLKALCKWQYYFEVNRKQFAVSQNETKKIPMSKDCEISVRNAGNNSVELQLIGKGVCVSKTTRALPKGETLVTGGNAPNTTAWFIALRQTD